MNLDRVTITGADDSIGSPENLLELTSEFPFVEWGILASVQRFDSPRFPSRSWIAELIYLAEAVSMPMSLSLHLCGAWVREILLGDISGAYSLAQHEVFQRIQLNFHAERTKCNPPGLARALMEFTTRQYIFQIDGATGNRHLESLFAEGTEAIDAVPLFDVSGGAGILPAEWPKPQYMSNDVDHIYHGYAGGLGPENLEQQLPLIAAAAGPARIWIDMETRVRSPDDTLFDLNKVRRCLEICAPFIAKENHHA